MFRRSYLFFAFLLLLASAGSVLYKAQSAAAVTAGDWNAGRIIDDSVFMNSGAMSVAQIQAFLDSRIGTGGFDSIPGRCDTNGSRNAQPYSNSTRAQYASSLGRPSTFTCLNGYYEVPKTSPGPGVPANNYGGAPVPAGAKSAASLIYDAAQTYGISPMVLLVKIQTESAGPLTTDDWPFQKQYTYAMGAHCPDSGPGGAANCDSNYAGFSIQIAESASLFRYYLDNMGQSWWPYKKLGNNSILYQNAKPECGSSNVNITTRATAALYTYTPYQPNQAALNNMYGTGDACSAYGNRNFWRTYNDWFGNGYGQAYYASYYAQSNYPQLNPGQQSAVFLSYQNNGINAWYDDMSIGSAPTGTHPVHLATSHLLNRDSAFSATWPNASRPAVNFSAVYESDGTTLASNQHVAVLGQIVKFSFTVTVPGGLVAASYPEYFMPIAEGSDTGLFNDPGTALFVIVNPVPRITYVGQSGYPTILPGTTSAAFLNLRNNGSLALYDDTSIGSAPAGSLPVHLATSNPVNRNSNFSGDWPNVARPAVNFSAVYNADGTTLSSNQHVAQPGQIVKFSFNFVAPPNFGANSYQEYIRPILEGSSDGYFADQGISWTVTVPQTMVLAVTTAPQSLNLVANQPGSVSLTVKNVGNTATGTGAQLGTGSASNLVTPTWISNSIIQTLPQDLTPGQSIVLTVPVLAPSAATNLNTSLGCVFTRGATTIPTTSACSTPVQVAGASYHTSNVSSPSLVSLAANQSASVSFMYKNNGNQPWYDDTSLASATSRNPLPMHLATAGSLNRSSGFYESWPNVARPAVNFSAVYNADGTTLSSNQHVAQPGQIVKFSFNLSPKAWVPQGTYNEYFQPIIEGTSDGATNDVNTAASITVLPATYVAAYAGQSAYPRLSPGQQASVYFMYQNNGNQTWYDDTSISSAPTGSFPVHLGTSHQINRASAFSAGWPNFARPAVNFSAVYNADGTTLSSNQHVAQPGQIVKFSFNMTAPAYGLAYAAYPEYFMPVAEGTQTGAFNDPGTSMSVTTVSN